MTAFQFIKFTYKFISAYSDDLPHAMHHNHMLYIIPIFILISYRTCNITNVLIELNGITRINFDIN